VIVLVCVICAPAVSVCAAAVTVRVAPGPVIVRVYPKLVICICIEAVEHNEPEFAEQFCLRQEKTDKRMMPELEEVLSRSRRLHRRNCTC
jgi:hypothetical protein